MFGNGILLKIKVGTSIADTFNCLNNYRAIRYTVHISFPPRCTVNRGSTDEVI